MEHLTFSFIGGDLRQLQVVNMLLLEGYRVNTFGLCKGDANEKDSLEECVKGADYIILPLPYSKDKKTVNGPFYEKEIMIDDLINEIYEGQRVIGGRLDGDIKKRCMEKGALALDYTEREDFAVMNAVPTAEGAILKAIENTPCTLKECNCLVIGYGRIGKILSAYLKGLGARVTATSRHKNILAEIDSFGYSALKTDNINAAICDFDIIFNTVPHMIMDLKCLMLTKKDVLIIDLASKPGGVDFDEAKRLQRKVLWELSLPGRVAPYTAGRIVKETVLNMVEELEV